MRILGLPFALFFVVSHAGFAEPSNAVAAANQTSTNDAALISAGIKKPGQQNKEADQGQADEKKHTPEWVGNAIALINVLVVFYIFWRTETSHREEHRRERVRSVKLFWVQELILNPNIESLHDFFNKYEEEMEKISGNSTCPSTGKLNLIAEKKALEFKKDFNPLRRKIIHPLLMVSPDFRPLLDIFAEIEDFVLNEYTRIPGAPRTPANAAMSPIEHFRELGHKFFAELHRGQMLLADSQ
jgi:hypothetical protein